MKLNRKPNQVRALDILLFCTWGYSVILYYFRTLTSKLMGINSLDNPILGIIIVTVVAFSLPGIIKHIKLIDVFCYAFVVVLFYLNYVLYPGNAFYLDEVKSQFLVNSALLYFVGLSVDIERNKKMLRDMAIASIVIVIAIMLFLGGAEQLSGEVDHNMGQAYDLLPHVLVLLWLWFEEGGGLNVVFSLIGILLLFSFGTRGPIVCVIIFVVSFFLFYKEFKYPVAGRITTVAVGILFYLFLKPLMTLLLSFLQAIGMSTRIAEKYLDNTIMDANGRDILHDQILNMIDSGPFWGYGFAGDRQFLGGWSHNIHLEMMAAFGRIPGTAIVVILIVFIVSTLYASKYSIYGKFMLLLVCCCIELFFSSSFLILPVFYLMLGYGMQIRRKRFSSF